MKWSSFHLTPSGARLLGWGLPFLLAAAVACFATLRLGPVALRYSALGWGVAGALTLGLLLPMRWGVLQFLAPRLAAYPPRARLVWLLGCVAGALFLRVAIPLEPVVLKRAVVLEVTATGEKHPEAQGTEVWVQRLVSRSGGLDMDVSPTQTEGTWTARDGALFSQGSPPATLRWEGVLEEDATLSFTRHAWSGITRISLDGQGQRVDLFSATPSTWVLDVPASIAQDSFQGRWVRRIGRLSDGVSLSLLLLLAGLGLSSWKGRAREEADDGWGWLAPAGVCVAVWSMFLVAFWPGLLSIDSLSQWKQTITERFSNGHPAFHTMLLWLITRVWDSPAAVALLQVGLLALVFAYTLRELGRWGVPARVRWVVTLLFAVSPVNCALSITLWKDIAYAITLLALSALLLKLARTRGEALRSRGFMGGLAGLLTLTMVLRHNGIPLSVALLGLLLIILPRGLKGRMGRVALGSGVMFVLISGPFYSALRVRPVPRVFAYSLVFHQLGAIAHSAPDSLSAEDVAVLESIQPMTIWRDGYTPYVVNPLIYNNHVRWSRFDESPEPGRALVGLWRRLAPRHLPLLIRHQLSTSSMVWKVFQEPGSYTYLYQLKVPENPMGLRRDSLSPPLERVLGAWLAASATPGNLTWFWRPAIALYVCLFCAVIAVVRTRKAWVLLGILPAVLNSALLMGLSLAQDFRYQYAMYVLGIVSLALAFVRHEAREAEVSVAPPRPAEPIAAPSPLRSTV